MTTETNTGWNKSQIDAILQFLYGSRAMEASGLLDKVLQSHASKLKQSNKTNQSDRMDTAEVQQRFSEKDSLLITYGDMVSAQHAVGAPLQSENMKAGALARLADFFERRMRGLFSYIHILPFFPYSSDDGFSVIDYRTVDPALGTWEDIKAAGNGRKLAFDLVINHASAQSAWFSAFKAGIKPYDRFFIRRPLDYDAKTVLRPRTHPLITPVTLDNGQTAGVWTTFSADQVDLDFSEPAVLVEFVDIMLDYAARGAGLLRLDAIAYLWKADDTSCAHLPQTHAVVKLVRAIIDALGLDMVVLTETNVPHEENMSYFGKGDEAHMVYNFSLPPLVLHAFATGDAGPLSRWATNLRVPDGGTLLNFLASHDGIGVTPARNLVPDFERTIAAVKERGGLVSYKATPEGPVPYELNISWGDAVARPDADERERAHALIASYAVACAMDGVPALYFHSMFGSRNWKEGPALLGYNRAINRERPALDALESQLDDPGSMRAISFAGLSSLLRERARRPVFSPASPRRAWPMEGSVFAVERGSGHTAVLVLVNCSGKTAHVYLPESWLTAKSGFDPVNGQEALLNRTGNGKLELEAYQVIWIE
jgi:sucrose phosphorylase